MREVDRKLLEMLEARQTKYPHEFQGEAMPDRMGYTAPDPESEHRIDETLADHNHRSDDAAHEMEAAETLCQHCAGPRSLSVHSAYARGGPTLGHTFSPPEPATQSDYTVTVSAMDGQTASFIESAYSVDGALTQLGESPQHRADAEQRYRAAMAADEADRFLTGYEGEQPAEHGLLYQADEMHRAAEAAEGHPADAEQRYPIWPDGPPNAAYYMHDEPPGQYIPPQQLTPGGPVHGGFTILPEPTEPERNWEDYIDPDLGYQ